MRWNRPWSALRGFALIVAALVTTAFASAHEPEDIGAPKAAFEHFIAAFNALDWDSFRTCFADQASVFNPEIPEVTSLHRLDGRAAFERAFRGVFESAHAGGAQAGPHIVPENVRVQRFDTTAVVTFEFKRAGGSYGRRTVVLHEEGGSWLIVHIHASNAAADRP